MSPSNYTPDAQPESHDPVSNAVASASRHQEAAEVLTALKLSWDRTPSANEFSQASLPPISAILDKGTAPSPSSEALLDEERDQTARSTIATDAGSWPPTSDYAAVLPSFSEFCSTLGEDGGPLVRYNKRNQPSLLIRDEPLPTKTRYEDIISTRPSQFVYQNGDPLTLGHEFVCARNGWHPNGNKELEMLQPNAIHPQDQETWDNQLFCSPRDLDVKSGVVALLDKYNVIDDDSLAIAALDQQFKEESDRINAIDNDSITRGLLEFQDIGKLRKLYGQKRFLDGYLREFKSSPPDEIFIRNPEYDTVWALENAIDIAECEMKLETWQISLAHDEQKIDKECEKLIEVFKDVVAETVESQGWQQGLYRPFSRWHRQSSSSRSTDSQKIQIDFRKLHQGFKMRTLEEEALLDPRNRAI
ncbi:hypothetical protein F5Y16DRAFT_400262 [Xylariaceae sp. FL0255]|nr:hypothetical protein F5Y16DRAFT_400262 [Xylariaceae sp. FL0255]